MENIGTNLSAWIVVGKALILIAIVIWAGKSVKDIYYAKKGTFEHEDQKLAAITKATKAVLSKVLLLILLTLFFFFFFGSGKKTTLPPASEEGKYQQLMETEDMPTEEEIKIDAHNKKPKVLRDQDSIKTQEMVDDEKEFERILEEERKKKNK